MKTLKTFYLLTLSTLLSLAACSKDEGSDTPQPLTIEQTEYTLDAIDNRSTTLSFTATAAWTLSVTGEDSDWLTVTPAIGTAGSKSVTLTAAPRITEESRTAYVDIACGAQTVQITVTQTGASADADFTSLFDPVFADFLEQEDIISDVGKITRQDMETIASVTELEIGSGHSSSESLTNLRGIEFFKSLKHLGFQETAWTSLDVSGCSTLTLLYCLRTEFTKLNVSGCTALRTLDCEGDRLTSLDAGGCTALEILSCKKSRLTSLNISGCTALKELNCRDNQLATLDLGQCPELQKLDCCDNGMTSLDISHCTALQELHCFDNLLTGLDISKNRALNYLRCERNPGNGLSTFPITAWFDNETRPESVSINYLSWVYNNRDTTIDFRKAE